MAKKLLSEAAIRRFATLANLPVINEMSSMYEQEEELPPEEPVGEPVEELPPEEPMDDMEGGEDLELTDEEAQAIIDLGKKLEAAMPEGEAEEEMPGAEEELPPEEPMEPVGEPGEEDILEALKGINYIPEKKEVVEEVARRVAKRLLRAKRAQSDLTEALGSRQNTRARRRRAKK